MVQQEQLEQKDQELEQKELQLEQNKKELAEKDQVLRSMVPVLRAAGWTAEKIAGHLRMTEQEVRDVLNAGK